MKKVFIIVSVLAIMALCLQCKPKTSASPDANFLTEEEISQGWKLLFDGETFTGWRNFGKDTLAGWVVDSGKMLALGQGGDHGNDIINGRAV